MKNSLLLICLLPLLSGCGVVGWFIPPVAVYVAEMDGKAKLAHAQFEKEVQVADAKGKEESAAYLARAEIERARGVAQANEIIGSSLKNNEAYLRWLYIKGLEENKNDSIIYVPTEAGLPILEAGKRK